MTTAIEIIRRRSATSGLVAERSADIDIARRGWERMGILLGSLDNPQLACRTIHIAGSKGKGTTTHIAAGVLQAAGHRVGRYTSPHLLTWNERIAIDDRSISDADLDHAVGEVDRVMTALESERPHIGAFSSFELLTAAAFLHFRERDCAWAVIEVGLGGRFDSTNHLRPAATVITRIEREHPEILGPEIADIAWNKAGIIKSGTPVVVAAQPANARAVIEHEAAIARAPLYREGTAWSVVPGESGIRYSGPDLPTIDMGEALPGAHNRSNLGAALTAVHLATGSLPPSTAVSRKLASIRIPGRFDRRTHPATGRELILDVAHTPESVRALIETSKRSTGRHQFPFIVGLLTDKPALEILAAIKPAASIVVFPELDNPRAVPAADLVAAAESIALRCERAPSVESALVRLSAGAGPLVVTGSFAVVAAALRSLSSRDTSPA
jgi:dihydrofolate synthase/folylpolyglutamate synthase